MTGEAEGVGVAEGVGEGEGWVDAAVLLYLYYTLSVWLSL